MRRFSQILTTAVMTGAFFLTAHVASAQTDDYRDSMGPFVPQIQNWVNDAQSFVDAATVKPELACTSATTELLRRGHSIAEDLKGTVDVAPEGLVKTHNDLTIVINRMTIAVGSTCQDSRTAALRMARISQTYHASIGKILNYLNLRPAGGGAQLPEPPVSVN